jgi:uncharacterized protein YbjT (DUF2867 family)
LEGGPARSYRDVMAEMLVTGSAGNLGAEVVRALLDAGHEVRGLVRPGRDAALPNGAEAVEGDLDRPATLSGALSGIRAVFLLSGYADMPGVLAEARDAGVERVVLLSSGSAVEGRMDNAIARYNILSEAAVRDSGVPWTILQPSGFMSNALRWLPQLQVGDVVRAPFADVRIASIDPADVAAVAARALAGEDPAGASHLLTGPEAMLPADQLGVLASMLARDLRLEGQSDDEARAELAAAWPPAFVDAFFRFFADGEFDDSIVRPTVSELLSRPPRTFEQWAAAHLDAFR